MGNFRATAAEYKYNGSVHTVYLTPSTFLAPIPSESSSLIGEQQPGSLCPEESVSQWLFGQMGETTTGLDGIWPY